jgi:hypothetical protein
LASSTSSVSLSSSSSVAVEVVKLDSEVIETLLRRASGTGELRRLRNWFGRDSGLVEEGIGWGDDTVKEC